MMPLVFRVSAASETLSSHLAQQMGLRAVRSSRWTEAERVAIARFMVLPVELNQGHLGDRWVLHGETGKMPAATCERNAA